VTHLRPYQEEAISSIIDYWAGGGGNPLCDMATGTGKSIVISTLVRRLIEADPDVRILMLVHVKELVQQNANALLRSWPQAPVGINAAGLGRRDKRSQILYASIQSVAKEDAHSLGPRHVIIVDEAHLIPKSGNGQYRKLIDKMKLAMPGLRIAGFTATPYRLDSGRLDDGGDALFDDVVCSYDIGRGVDDGYLSPLTCRRTGAVIDVSEVKCAGGEFVAGALEAAVNKDIVTQAACDEIVSKGADRRAWLAFCAGVAHAEAVRDALRARGIHAEMVTGETTKGDRDRIIRDFREGRIKCLTNANVLTTGFDAPICDLIAMLRPTLSTSLYVQMLGRGTRLNEGKADCLVLDFAENVRRHGPVDAIHISGRSVKSDGGGRTEVDAVKAKACPHCETLVSVRVYECTGCGYEWERPAEPKHHARADTDAAVMSREIVNRWLQVASVDAARHEKPGSIPSMRVEYYVGVTEYREWICVEHPGFAGAKAAKWWRSIVGTPAPASVADGVARLADEAHILAITIQRDGKYWRVSGWRVRRPDGRIVEIDDKLNARPVALQIVREATE